VGNPSPRPSNIERLLALSLPCGSPLERLKKISMTKGRARAVCPPELFRGRPGRRSPRKELPTKTSSDPECSPRQEAEERGGRAPKPLLDEASILRLWRGWRGAHRETPFSFPLPKRTGRRRRRQLPLARDFGPPLLRFLSVCPRGKGRPPWAILFLIVRSPPRFSILARRTRAPSSHFPCLPPRRKAEVTAVRPSPA